MISVKRGFPRIRDPIIVNIEFGVYIFFPLFREATYSFIEVGWALRE